MLDKDTGARFDHDPNLDRPLRAETQQFLRVYRESVEFRNHYENNLSLHGELGGLSDIGKRKAIWSTVFVNRLFNLSTLGEADRLLEPWIKWSEAHSKIWFKYWREDGDKDVHARYEESEKQFAQVEIPPEIKQYQGDLQDEDLRSLAHWEIFKLTKEIRESVDLFEDITKPVSLDTLFRAQRVMNQPAIPAGGLEEHVVNKPSVRRIEHDGKNYIAFDFEGEPTDTVSEDPSSEEEWQRWNHIEAGTRVKYLREDSHAKEKTFQNGVVHGFDLLGAGDVMLFGPSVANIGIIVVNDETRFYQCPLISDIRLESEEFTVEELKAKEQPKAVDFVIVRPSTGEVTQQSFESMEEATEAVKKQIVQVVQEFRTEQ